MAKYSVMSTSQEGLGEHTRGPATLECEVFCPALVSEDLKASEMNTCAPRRYRRRKPTHREDTRGKGFRDKDPSAKEVLEMKTYTLSDANDLCYRSSRRSQSPKMKTS
jgi:hypothetical protein